jgi:hypothetical protein
MGRIYFKGRPARMFPFGSDTGNRFPYCDIHAGTPGGQNHQRFRMLENACAELKVPFSGGIAMLAAIGCARATTARATIDDKTSCQPWIASSTSGAANSLAGGAHVISSLARFPPRTGGRTPDALIEFRFGGIQGLPPRRRHHEGRGYPALF